MSCMENVTEEKIIDFVIGNLNEKEQEQVKEHLTDCQTCLSIYESWERMELDRIVDEAVPSKIKRRLFKKINRAPFFHFGKTKLMTLSFIITATAILFLYIDDITKEHPTMTAIPQYEPFLMSENTMVYKLEPVIRKNISGYAWINGTSNEMLIFVDGISPITVNDYQAWIKTNNELRDAGIITLNGNTGQFYVKDGMVNNVEHIMISREPKGGSIQPTDPNAYIIKLKSDY